jgi:translation initiation factor IF-2
MFDYRGNRLKEAGPSAPVSVMGLNQVPSAGDLFVVAESEREARVLIQKRHEADRELGASRSALTLENMFDRIQAGDVRELRLVVKADVQGSLEPIVSSLEEMTKQGASVNVLRAEPGDIGENDVLLASASSAIILGFNVEADSPARRLAEKEGVSIRLYSIIYRLTEDVEKALKGLLEPEEKEVVLGRAEVRAKFRIPRSGTIAGCYVLEGEVRRNARVRVYRAGAKIHEGEMSSLRHYQEDVREVRQGFECGIGVRDFNDFEEGDIIESFTRELVPVD